MGADIKNYGSLALVAASFGDHKEIIEELTLRGVVLDDNLN